MTGSKHTGRGSGFEHRGKNPMRNVSVVGGGLFLLIALFSTGARPNTQRVDGPGLEPPVMFETSATCLGCHNGLVTPSGNDVSIGADWRGSMMANSARDPYWQAAVRRETMDHPPASAAIEKECSTCHMPMAHYTARVGDEPAEVFAHLPVKASGQAASRASLLAGDGVGCAMCHQITSEDLGTEASFVGGFVIDSQTPSGSRRVYGPFDVDSGRTRIMHSASGFAPRMAPHIQESELCASCHTLITHAMNDEHEVVGELPEQVPYLEWLHSDYAYERGCQSCHMPVVEDSVNVSSVWGQPRAEVNQHAFRGGNFLMPRIFSRFGASLGVEATTAELQTSIKRTLDHLQSSAASVQIENPELDGNRLTADVRIVNHAGHKLPTAYPSRRVWLHLTVSDPSGEIVFESGALNDNGSIVGNDNDDRDGAFEPHYNIIRSAHEVQIYEAVMEDAHGRITTGLTSGLRFVKDNRVLPKGFDKMTADSDIAVQGRAMEDVDFTQRSDLIRIELDGDFTADRYEIRAELWYQPVGYRWAMNLAGYDAMETQRFVDYYRGVSHASAVQLTGDTASIDR